jgi:YVTN family beta-propeller protein
MLNRSGRVDRAEGVGNQVARRRRRRRVAEARRRATPAVVAGAVVLAGAGVTYAATTGFGRNHVGTEYANGIQVSDDQIIKPLGERLLTQFGKFMGSTVSPDGRFLAATSTDKSVSLQIIDLSNYKLIWTVGTASGVNQKYMNTTVGQEGPTYSPDGKTLWLPQKDGLARFAVNPDGTLGTPTTVPIPAVNGHSALVGQTRYSPDGSTLYAAVNGQNTVVALDPTTGAVNQTWNVGIAPRELAFAWRCVVSWHLPASTVTGSAIYQLDVTPDRRYVADGDGPQEVNGFFQLRTPAGDAPNSLWQFDGSVDLLAAR